MKLQYTYIHVCNYHGGWGRAGQEPLLHSHVTSAVCHVIFLYLFFLFANVTITFHSTQDYFCQIIINQSKLLLLTSILLPAVVNISTNRPAVRGAVPSCVHTHAHTERGRGAGGAVIIIGSRA